MPRRLSVPGVLFRLRADDFPRHSGMKAVDIFTFFNRLKDHNRRQAVRRAKYKPTQLNSFFSQVTKQARRERNLLPATGCIRSRFWAHNLTSSLILSEIR